MGIFGFGKKKEEEKNPFLSFVLLKNAEWDKNKFINDLKEDWGLQISAQIGENNDHKLPLLTEISGKRITIHLDNMPIPNRAAEESAGTNYLWKEATDVVKEHNANLVVYVDGFKSEYIKTSALMAKITSTLLKQNGALAVFSYGNIYEPKFYQNFLKNALDENEIPIYNLVWFGIKKTQDKIGVYTNGMKQFGKEEIEVYVNPGEATFEELHEFLYDIVSYVLENDALLLDGQTIGASLEQKCKITYSKGIALETDTLKIEYIK